MNFVNYITMILLSLQPSYSDNETWSERTARMEIIAEAIEDASAAATCTGKYETSNCKKVWAKDKKSLALLLVTKGYWESKFAKNVHEGKCRKYECDSYMVNGNVLHRARSPWQIQRTGMVTKEEYSAMNSASLDSTKMSANVAVRYLANGMSLCKTISGAIAIYGGSKTCNWKGAAPREAFYKSLISKSEDQLLAAADAQKVKLESRLERVFLEEKNKK